MRVTGEGLGGDEQGDRVHHGGVDKAVHHYAHDHYERWQQELPGEQPLLKAPGAFGENLSTTGVTEADVCLGDVVRIGDVRLEVCQARQPCWRLNVRFGQPDMARRVQDSGRSGWYYRVLEPGWIAPGDAWEVLERPHPEWPMSRTLDVLHRDPLNRDALADLAAVPALAAEWRGLIERRLERGVVEDWERRLTTPAG